MKVLDLCAGTGSSTQAFRALGADVVGVELDPSFGARITMDLLEFAKDPEGILDRLVAPGWRPDVVWASPPCTVFSMAGSGKGRVRWVHLPRGDWDPFYGPRVPAAPESRLGVALVLACLQVIRKLKPRWWWLENPQGGLQTLGFMQEVPGPATVTYCQYGERRMKPTCLWGVWPLGWVPRPRCYNGDSCHDAAPRGARTGTQGLADAKLRAMVPVELSRSIAVACMGEAA